MSMQAIPSALPEILREQAVENPDHVYLETVDGEVATYADFDLLVETWAGRLVTLGVARGDRIATVLTAGLDETAIWIAASWLGAVEVPVNPVLTGDLLSHMLNLSRAAVVIGSVDVVDNLDAIASGLESTQVVVVEDATGCSVGDLPVHTAADVAVSPDARDFSAPPQMDDLAAVLFTSGTSGLPKGVMMPWGQIHATAEEVAPSSWWGEDDVVYSPYPPFHVSGKAPTCLMGIRGGRVVLRESFKTQHFFGDIVEHGCTMTMLVGGTAQFLLDQPPSPSDVGHPLRIVHMLPIIDRALEFEERFGVRVCGSFNMTEVSCPIVTGPDRIRDVTSMGLVRRGYAARVVDENDYAVPDGQVGELLIRAERPWALAAGYLDRPEATLEAWRNQWFHTGDLVRRDAGGRYHFVERRSDTIRRRGENISSSLLESIVIDHPDVHEVVVVGVPSEFGEFEIMAWIVPEATARRDDLLTELAGYVADRIPSYMVPRFWRLADQLPRTPTAKVRRAALQMVDDETWDRSLPRSGSANTRDRMKKENS